MFKIQVFLLVLFSWKDWRRDESIRGMNQVQSVLEVPVDHNGNPRKKEYEETNPIDE